MFRLFKNMFWSSVSYAMTKIRQRASPLCPSSVTRDDLIGEPDRVRGRPHFRFYEGADFICRVVCDINYREYLFKNKVTFLRVLHFPLYASSRPVTK